MTCVVAIIDRNKNIYMGADSQGTCISTHRKNSLTNKKVFFRDDFLFGFSGSFRMGNLLRHVFEIPEHPESMSIEKYIHTIFIKKIIECFNENNLTRKSEEVISAHAFLVGYKGVVFLIDADFQVSIHDESYMAIGSGSEVALGYLFNHTYFDSMNSEEILINSLWAAEKFNITVGPPFTCLKLNYINGEK